MQRKKPSLWSFSKKQHALTLEEAIEAYLRDHEGGNHSPKTIEWHTTALHLLSSFLEQEQGKRQIEDVTSSDISAWFTHLRQHPGSRGKQRSERTIQTYARSARAFFHWLVRQGFRENTPFAAVVFPKVGKPLVQTITEDEFARLLLACTPPLHETKHAGAWMIARNRAMLWLLYDTGIRLSELIGLRIGDLHRKQGVITVRGKGLKERRIALGQECLRQVLGYLDRHRPDEEDLLRWGNGKEDHLFLSESRQPLTKNSIILLFVRLKKRAGITNKRISPHIFRHTFAVRYLILGNDPFSLQMLLGHADMTTVKHYMHMNDQEIQD